jgi:hypothetical protein
LVNSLYGTWGVNNISVITLLESSGIEVVREKNPSYKMEEEMRKAVNAVSSLEFQDRLDKDVDISTLFENYPRSNTSDGLATVCLAYDISQVFVIEGEINITFTLTEVWFYETANGFRMQIRYHWTEDYWLANESGDIDFTYEYKVTRY